MISGTIKASPMKFCTVIVLLKAYQNTKEVFRNLTCDVTMTLFFKQWENLDPLETRQMIYIFRKVMMRAFEKLNFY